MSVVAIASKELRLYFTSLLFYVLAAVFLVLAGYFFFTNLDFFVHFGGMNLPLGLWQYQFFDMRQLLLVLIPLLTMRLFAEEKRSGTIELLATSPIRDSEIIIGKWLAALNLYACMLLFTALNFAFLFKYGNPDWKPLAIGYLGLLLQAGGLLAIGTFISTLTRNQIIAGAATFGVCLLLWVLEWISGYETATWAQVLAYMSVITHFESFAKGVLDSKDAIFYLTVIFLGLFFTTRSMESLRWRS